jgi:lipopolysaccharide biosynthesis glycosyltransferase
MRALGLRPEDPYLNSGVLVISLEAWRSDDVRERAVALVRETILPWPDQDALNVVLRDCWKELPRRWNLQTQDAQGTGLSWVLWREEVELALSDVAVIHYSEYVKPWHAASAHPLRDRWYAVLDQTSFSGWRPSHAKRPLHQRVGSRARSAWQVLVTGSASSPPSPV